MTKFAAKAGAVVVILVAVTLGYVYRDVYIRRLPPGWFNPEQMIEEPRDLEVTATPALPEGGPGEILGYGGRL